MEFTTPTEEVHKDWLQQEALMSQALMRLFFFVCKQR